MPVDKSSQANIMHKIVLMQEKQKTVEAQKLVKEHQKIAQKHQKVAQESVKAKAEAEKTADDASKELHKLKLMYDPKYAWDYKQTSKEVTQTRRVASKKTKAAKRKRTPPSR